MGRGEQGAKGGERAGQGNQPLNVSLSHTFKFVPHPTRMPSSSSSDLGDLPAYILRLIKVWMTEGGGDFDSTSTSS